MRGKQLYWFSLMPNVEAQFERHRLPDECDSSFCRRMLDRFVSQQPKLIDSPFRKTRGLRTRGYYFQAPSSLAAQLGGVSLRAAIASISATEPTPPIQTSQEVFAALERYFGFGLIPLPEAIYHLQGRLAFNRGDCLGKRLLSELRAQKKIELRKLEKLSKSYKAIDGHEYTHLELLVADTAPPPIRVRELRDLLGGAAESQAIAFAMSPARIVGRRNLTLGFWLDSETAPAEINPKITIHPEKLAQADFYNRFSQAIGLLRHQPRDSARIEFDGGCTFYLAGVDVARSINTS